MKNTFGNSISVTVFGESHGPYIGAVLDGLAPGLALDSEYIREKLEKRRPSGVFSTKRVEADNFSIVSGAKDSYTTGSPLTIIIPNENTRSIDYENTEFIPRPSHADLSAQYKYHGFEDRRGGGHFSGRITAALVAAGAVLEYALLRKDIKICTHIKSIGNIQDRAFENSDEDFAAIEKKSFPVLDEKKEEEMKLLIKEAASEGDSIGGVLECAVTGVPGGLGEPWFDSVESVLSHILFSVPAVKGVEFGDGFEISKLRGSEANDPIATDGKSIYTKTNRNGGICGGITNGMPIIFRAAIKPTPSIYKEQDSVRLGELENTKLRIEGRHDPCIAHRAAAVINAVTAIAVSDLLAARFGTDFLAK